MCLSEKPFYDISDHDLLDVWETDIPTSVSDPFRNSVNSICTNDLDTYWPTGISPPDNGYRDSSSQVVRNDRLLTDSVYDRRHQLPSVHSSFPSHTQLQTIAQPPVKTEHSYSLEMLQGTVGSDGDSLPESPLSLNEDMDSECTPYLTIRPSCISSLTTGSSGNEADLTPGSSSSSSSSSICGSSSAESSCFSSDEGSSTIKEEPQSRPTSPLPSVTTLLPQSTTHIYQSSMGYLVKDEPNNGGVPRFSVSPMRQSPTLRPSATAAIFLSPSCKKSRIGLTETKLINIKVEADQSSSCNGSSNLSILDCDQQQQQVKQRSQSNITFIRTSPNKSCSQTQNRNIATATTKVVFGQTSTGPSRHPIQTSLISYQPKGAIGELCLTEEEKRTLISEGYPIPQRLPLTKSEEESLKKIRRKIKNKISAQESRRKKKEYMDSLEKRMEGLSNDVDTYRQRCNFLEQQNSALQLQLQKLQAQLVSAKVVPPANQNKTNFSNGTQNQRTVKT